MTALARKPWRKRAPVNPKVLLAERVLIVGECWVWQGAKTKGGYGHLSVGGKHVLAHRHSYELFTGPIPEGKQIDHLCRNRACCNPAHMEPVTCRENILRGESSSAAHARQTHCKHGHEFTPENTWVYGNSRKCKMCDLERQASRRAASSLREVTA